MRSSILSLSCDRCGGGSANAHRIPLPLGNIENSSFVSCVCVCITWCMAELANTSRTNSERIKQKWHGCCEKEMERGERERCSIGEHSYIWFRHNFHKTTMEISRTWLRLRICASSSSWNASRAVFVDSHFWHCGQLTKLLIELYYLLISLSSQFNKISCASRDSCLTIRKFVEIER